MTPTEWRQKHPRCRFCKNHGLTVCGDTFCTIKIKFKSSRIPRWICKWQGFYEVKK